MIIFGGDGTKFSMSGGPAGEGPRGIEGYYILMWRGFALWHDGARLVWGSA